MRRALLISPHFPPDTGAATHRVRLLAPHLTRHGWEPTVLTVTPEAYAGRLEPELLRLVPDSLRVVRAPSLPPRERLPGRIGVGDLGVRAFPGLLRAADRLLGSERFDALLVTAPPHPSLLLGPLLKRRHGVPLVLDYQDPWVGAWGASVGGGPGGRVDWKSRASRALGQALEPRALPAADAVTAVSRATWEEAYARCGLPVPPVSCELPLGGDPGDFDYLRAHPRPNPHFDAGDGRLHLCYVGTLLPLGFETLRALLRGVAEVRARRPELAARLRLHFFGTSNQTDPAAPARVLPIARELGVADLVREVAPRIDYLEALTVLTQAGAILMLGSSERHYTASKLYPGLLARRPVLALYHQASLVTDTLRRWTRPPSVRVVAYDDLQRAEARVPEVTDALVALLEGPGYDPGDVTLERILRLADDLAGDLAAVFDAVARP